eukprot:13429449-Alexandrium_andersonii.AAC.1
MWPVKEAPLSLVMALSAERRETASATMSGVVASYYDQRNEEYPLDACYPPTVQVPDERRAARVESEDVLAAATEQRRQGGVDPEQTVAAGARFRER